MLKRRAAPVALALLLALAGSALAQEEAPAAAQGDPFAIFAVSDESSARVLGYDALDQFLGVYTTRARGRTAIYFGAMEGEGADYLKAYAALFQKIDPRTLTRDEQLAFWLNLRTVMVLNAFAGERRVGRIDDERGTFAAPGEVWARRDAAIAGVPMSIHDIETEIILRHWDNPDVLYGLYQGARGGPSLSEEAFRGATIAADLKALGKAYVNGARTLRFKNDAVTAPAVYGWYKAALFGDNDAAVLAHFRALLDNAEDKGKAATATSVVFADFDYSSDAAEPRQVQQVGPDFVRRETIGPSTGGGGGVGIGS